MLKCDCSIEGDRYFLAIANAAGDIIHFNDAGKPIRNASRATETLLGYAFDGLEGRPAMDIIHPEDRKVFLNAMKTVIADSTSPFLEIRIVKKNGALIDAQMSTFTFSVDGKVRAGAVLRDISAKRRMERSLEKLQNIQRNMPSSAPRQSENVDSNIISVCAYCKKIRNKSGTWISPITYLQNHKDVILSHGLCPQCVQTYYPGFSSKKTTGDDG